MPPPPAPRERSLRPLWTVAAVALLLLMALPMLAAWRIHARSGALGERLVEDVQRLAQRPYERASHAAHPLPGSVADALGPLLDPLIELRDAEPPHDEGTAKLCTEFRQGVRDVIDLPASCREPLERGRALLLQLAPASRAERGDLPASVRTFADQRNPHAMRGLAALLHMTRLSGLEVRLRLERGDAAGAIELCTDQLALARDVGHGAGLIGAMIHAAMVGALFEPCAAAINGADATQKARALIALRIIRSGDMPPSWWMAEERAATQLIAFGGLLRPDQLQRLPAGAASLLDTVPGTPGSTVIGRHAWVELDRLWSSVDGAFDLPAAERAARLIAVQAEAEAAWNPVVNVFPDYERYMVRDEERRAKLDLLIALAAGHTVEDARFKDLGLHATDPQAR